MPCLKKREQYTQLRYTQIFLKKCCGIFMARRFLPIIRTMNITTVSTGTKKAIAGAAVWLLLITTLHLYGNYPSDGDRLKIGFLPITCHLLLPVAMARVPDMKIEALKFSSWPDMIEALKGGDLDGAFILAPIAMAMAGQGVPLKIVLLGHRDGTGLVVKNDGEIRDAGELAGKTVAIPIRYSDQNIALLRLLDQAHVDIKSVNIIEMPPPDMPSALASGAIEAYIVGEPYAAWSEINGSGKVLYQMKDFWPGFISSVLVMRNDVMREKRKEAVKFIRSVYRQGTWVEQHRRDAALICASFFGLSETLIEYVLEQPADRVSYNRLLPEPEELDEIGRLMRRYGLADRIPDGKEITDISWQ
jgi:NitT/TauT family transport system substrate-binding protein